MTVLLVPQPCPVCLCKLSEDSDYSTPGSGLDVVQMKCAHMLHRTCFEQYLKSSTTSDVSHVISDRYIKALFTCIVCACTLATYMVCACALATYMVYACTLATYMVCVCALATWCVCVCVCVY